VPPSPTDPIIASGPANGGFCVAASYIYAIESRAKASNFLRLYLAGRGDWVMVVLFAGTFDDSGDQDDPQHNCASLGGYIGPAEAWECFEIEWKDVLDTFNVPYLHMREFKDPTGHYAHLLKDRDKMALFFGALADVIGHCGLFAFGSVVRISDLKRFNVEFSADIDGYSLTLADCLGNISLQFPGTRMELRVDRVPKAVSKITLAHQYLSSSKSHPECIQNVETFISVMPYTEGMTFRTVQAIQAADFAAWEMRKSVIAKDKFYTEVKPNVPEESWFWELSLSR
jgi:hypothetical protein